jgi:hypothetical protein
MRGIMVGVIQIEAPTVRRIIANDFVGTVSEQWRSL